MGDGRAGKVDAVAKRANKDKVIAAYNEIHDKGLFSTDEERETEKLAKVRDHDPRGLLCASAAPLMEGGRGTGSREGEAGRRESCRCCRRKGSRRR